MGTGGVSTNITDRRNKEQKIIELNESLEHKVRIRTKELEASLHDLKETQEQLVESEKMSALGSLVAGVAHEINTPIGIGIMATSHLTEVMNNFNKEYLSGKLQRESLEHFISVNQESLNILHHNLKRAADLISNFKQIAVDQSSEQRRQFELGAYLQEIANSVAPRLKKGGHSINIEMSQLIHMDSYPGALAQIMTNLIINSLEHGFKNLSGREIQINATLSNNEVHIDYRDNGVGLDQGQREKVFDPFYTTSRGEGGSGLGMSISYNLVSKILQGRIRCIHSDSGAHFEIDFPVTPDE